jgi:hypothetical protein
LPKGPVGVPSGASGPWPDTKARCFRMRIHSNEMVHTRRKLGAGWERQSELVQSVVDAGDHSASCPMSGAALRASEYRGITLQPRVIERRSADARYVLYGGVSAIRFARLITMAPEVKLPGHSTLHPRVSPDAMSKTMSVSTVRFGQTT